MSFEKRIKDFKKAVMGLYHSLKGKLGEEFKYAFELYESELEDFLNDLGVELDYIANPQSYNIHEDDDLSGIAGVPIFIDYKKDKKLRKKMTISGTGEE